MPSFPTQNGNYGYYYFSGGEPDDDYHESVCLAFWKLFKFLMFASMVGSLFTLWFHITVYIAFNHHSWYYAANFNIIDRSIQNLFVLTLHLCLLLLLTSTIRPHKIIHHMTNMNRNRHRKQNTHRYRFLFTLTCVSLLCVLCVVLEIPYYYFFTGSQKASDWYIHHSIFFAKHHHNHNRGSTPTINDWRGNHYICALIECGFWTLDTTFEYYCFVGVLPLLFFLVWYAVEIMCFNQYCIELHQTVSTSVGDGAGHTQMYSMQSATAAAAQQMNNSSSSSAHHNPYSYSYHHHPTSSAHELLLWTNSSIPDLNMHMHMHMHDQNNSNNNSMNAAGITTTSAITPNGSGSGNGMTSTTAKYSYNFPKSGSTLLLNHLDMDVADSNSNSNASHAYARQLQQHESSHDQHSSHNNSSYLGFGGSGGGGGGYSDDRGGGGGSSSSFADEVMQLASKNPRSWSSTYVCLFFVFLALFWLCIQTTASIKPIIIRYHFQYVYVSLLFTCIVFKYVLKNWIARKCDCIRREKLHSYCYYFSIEYYMEWYCSVVYWLWLRYLIAYNTPDWMDFLTCMAIHFCFEFFQTSIRSSKYYYSTSAAILHSIQDRAKKATTQKQRQRQQHMNVDVESNRGCGCCCCCCRCRSSNHNDYARMNPGGNNCWSMVAYFFVFNDDSTIDEWNTRSAMDSILHFVASFLTGMQTIVYLFSMGKHGFHVSEAHADVRYNTVMVYTISALLMEWIYFAIAIVINIRCNQFNSLLPLLDYIEAMTLAHKIFAVFVYGSTLSLIYFI